MNLGRLGGKRERYLCAMPSPNIRAVARETREVELLASYSMEYLVRASLKLRLKLLINDLRGHYISLTFCD